MRRRERRKGAETEMVMMSTIHLAAEGGGRRLESEKVSEKERDRDGDGDKNNINEHCAHLAAESGGRRLESEKESEKEGTEIEMVRMSTRGGDCERERDRQ